jgi:hypothetical protein
MPRKSKLERLNERIEELCERKGLHFQPHEIPPWDADEGPSPHPPASAGSLTWPMAQKLRRELIAELEAQDDAEG